MVKLIQSLSRLVAPARAWTVAGQNLAPGRGRASLLLRVTCAFLVGLPLAHGSLGAGEGESPAAPAVPGAADSAGAPAAASGPTATASGATGGLGPDSCDSDSPLVPDEVPHPRPFQVGERLKFSIQYGPIKAGTSELAVERVERVGDHDCYRFVSSTQSSQMFSAFYKVKDQIVSLADVRYLLTRRTSKRLREGNYKVDQEIDWDHDAKELVYEDGEKVEMKPGARDVLAAMYYTRTLPLAVGDSIRVPTHDNKKSYPIVLHVIGKEKADTPLGKFDCWVVEPLLETPGLFNRTGTLKVWLTNDEERVPVIMQSEVKVGAITAVLIERQRGAGGPDMARPAE
jgi:Protein of unknown function (DUF3108)